MEKYEDTINRNDEKSFSRFQDEEELDKDEWIKQNPGKDFAAEAGHSCT